MGLLDFLKSRSSTQPSTARVPDNPNPIQVTMFDRIDSVGRIAIVTGYRRIARERGCAPTAKTSNSQIIEIYSLVGTIFREASEQRGEKLRAVNLNCIVLSFIQFREMMPEVFEAHLKREVQKYRLEGLREDYKQEIKLL